MAKRYKTILAAGGVLWRERNGIRQVALIYRERYGGEWSLPKGKLEKGESFEQAALREILEETACRAEIEDFLASLDYRVKGKPKVVLFYRMRVLEERPFLPSAEIQALEWLEPEAALERLVHRQERKVLRIWMG
ncbi:MAG: NUDIX hydrolase [Bryobacterales bacterium]|nr:NUDIX hydrolase [Acidobacteriota bacterium]MCB9383250.1 NUDIX hydrolase [Bryobacterales bacterium]